MFSGNVSQRFLCDLSKDQFASKIADKLNDLGMVRVDERGDLSIRTRQSLENFFTKTKLKGDVLATGDEYTVTIEYDCTLSKAGWIIFVLGFFQLVGWVTLFGPWMKREEVRKAIQGAFMSMGDPVNEV